MAFVESTMEALVTSDRTTGQTVLDSDGKVKNAPHNIWPTTDLSDGTAWTQTSLTSVTESGTSPSGKAAYSLLENTDSGLHRIRDGFTSVVGETYSFVMDIKANGRTDFRMSLPASQFGTSVQYTFDLSAVTTTQDTAGTNDSSAITLISDGWYRLVVTAEATLAASATTSFLIMDGASQSYAGDITKGVYLSRPRVYKSAIHGYSGTDPQGMQLATDGSDYVETTSGPVYQLGRAFDGNAACLGMQSFEGRTNLQVYSNDFANATWTKQNTVITENSATSPDGTSNASKLTDNAATGTANCAVYNAITITANTDHVWSVFAKADQTDEIAIRPNPFDESEYTYFDLGDGTVLSEGASHSDSGMIDYGNGWYLCWCVYQSTTDVTGYNELLLSKAGSTAITLDGTNSVHIYGATVEAGAFPTPYIPTLSAAVARGADDASLLTSSFGYNASEGTVVAYGTPVYIGGSNDILWSLSTVSSNSMQAGHSVGGGGTGNASVWVRDVNVGQVFMNDAGEYVANASTGLAFAYKENDFAMSPNGETSTTDGAGTVPTITVLNIGGGADSGTEFNGYIKSLVYYPSRLIDASLERIST